MEKQSCVYFHHLKPSLSQTKSQHTRSVDLILLTRLRTLQPQFRPLAAPPSRCVERRAPVSTQEASSSPGSGRCSSLAGPGSDGIVVTWKDNFDCFYSEVAELGRYGSTPGALPSQWHERQSAVGAQRELARSASSWKLGVLHLECNR